MDMLGDAEPVDLTDQAWDDEAYVDVERPPSAPLMSIEAWAITALTLSVASLFVMSVAQFVNIFVAGNSGFGPQQDEATEQYLWFLGPTGAFGLLGAVCGGHVWRRRSDAAPWAAGVATAGLVLGALIALIVVAGLVILLVNGAPQQTDF
jgi:hypothetical protein